MPGAPFSRAPGIFGIAAETTGASDVPGYMVFEIEITDAQAWDDYRRVAGPLMAAAGGRFLANDPDPTPLEGGWTPCSLSIVEFPSVDAARAFYASPAYQDTVAMRQHASRGRGIVVAGLGEARTA
jgi:uncharacterized protein (DUF1330 family)